MIEVKINDNVLRDAAKKGNCEFVDVVIADIHNAIGGELNAQNMPMLNSNQITLLGWEALRDEVMEGGFIQLIHNGWGTFIFRNPFDKAVREWGMDDLCRIVRKAHKLYSQYAADIERDCTDEEFMSLYEHYPSFDELDDEFVEKEDVFTSQIAHYIDEHIDSFFKVDGNE